MTPKVDSCSAGCLAIPRETVSPSQLFKGPRRHVERGRGDLRFGKGVTVEIEGTPHEVVKMRRMMREGEAVSLIVEAQRTG